LVGAFEHPEHRMGRDYRRPGVPRRDQRGAMPVMHPPGRHHHGRAGLAPERLRRRLVHPDHVGSVAHLDIQRLRVGMPDELGVNLFGTPDEVHADAQMTGRGEGPIHGAPGRMIAAHGVDRYAHGVSG
jgi:hypothetical protein